jgi:hypothetical protein
VSAVGIPGIVSGAVFTGESVRLWGAEANAVRNRRDCSNRRTDWLAGFRYLDFEESLDIRDFARSLIFPAAVSGRVDEFDTRTQFWGGQVGGRAAIAWGRASLALTGKVGLGVSHLTVERRGLTTLNLPEVVLPGGVLVPFTNPIQRDTTDRFSVLSETTIQVGYQWTKWLQTTIGYNGMYLTSAVRAGDQIRPNVGINATDFWAQGVTFGVACRY